MKQHTIRYLLILLFSLPLIQVSGQSDDQNILVSTKGDTVLIKAIPISVITDSIETAYAKIKVIENNILPNKDLIKFDSIYNQALKGLEEEKEIIFNTDDHSSIREIDRILTEWKSYGEHLNHWKEILNTRIKTLENDDFQTDILIQSWNLTLKSAKEGGLPNNVLTNVTDISNKTKNLKKKVVDEKTEAFRKQNRITDLLLLVDEVDSYLIEQRKQLQSDYLRQDSPPIWAAADSTIQLSNLKAESKKALDSSINSFQVFYYSNERTLIIQLIIFLFLWIGFYLLHKYFNDNEETEKNEQLERANYVIARYAVSALIICLFMSIWLYPIRPGVVNDLVQMLYIIIAIYFLPIYINKKLRLVLYALLILFFLNEVQVFFPGKTFFSRLILFIEGFIAAWIIYKMVSKKYIIAGELKRRNWGVLLKIEPIFFVLLGVAFIGNIFGQLNLALLLSNTVVNALFNLVVMILVVMVTNSTVAILLRTPFMQSSNIIKNNLATVEKQISIVVQVLSVLIWVKSVLMLVGVYYILVEWLTDLIETKWEVGNSVIELGGILSFFVAILVTYLTYRVIKALLKEEFYPRVRLPRGVPGSISMIIGYLITGYGFFIAMSVAGVDLSSFGLIAGALGVGIGFGLQGIVANFIAGIVIAFERPIQVGDTIEIGTMMGDVKSIGVRSCTIKTFDGSEVIVPNSSLITNDVTNWTLSDRRKRRDVNVSAAYGSDPHKVLEVIKKVASDHPDVLKIPAPWAIFDGFGDSSLDFRVRIWTTMDNGMTTKSSVAINIYDAFEAAGIEIPFPQRDLHLRSVDPDIQGLGIAKPKPAAKKQTRKPKPKNIKDNQLNIDSEVEDSDDD